MERSLEIFLPFLSAAYRKWRDKRMFIAQVMRPTSLGFDFIGVSVMPEPRTASREVAMLRELLQGKGLFVDIGTNCGLYSRIKAKTGVPVLAVEPNPLNFLRLKQKIIRNQFGTSNQCRTFDRERRTARRDDVARWLRTGVRDFGDVNYIFQKA